MVIYIYSLFSTVPDLNWGLQSDTSASGSKSPNPIRSEFKLSDLIEKIRKSSIKEAFQYKVYLNVK